MSRDCIRRLLTDSPNFTLFPIKPLPEIITRTLRTYAVRDNSLKYKYFVVRKVVREVTQPVLP